jgi:nucleoside-diphosphate kinase
MQRTFVIFKPDCMAQRHVGNVLNRFETAGFTIVGCKLAKLTPAKLREHYAHVADKPFYPEIEAFMSSRPVIMMALEGDGATCSGPRTPARRPRARSAATSAPR